MPPHPDVDVFDPVPPGEVLAPAQSLEHSDAGTLSRVYNWRLCDVLDGLAVRLAPGERLIEDTANGWRMRFRERVVAVIPIYLLASEPRVERLGQVGALMIDVEAGKLVSMTPVHLIEREAEWLRGRRG